MMRTLVTILMTLAGTAAVAKTYPYQSCFDIAARMHQVPLEVLLAVAATESDWDPDARSDANAHGIMQIQWPGTARHLGVRRVAELYNPCLNIELGARYLKELLQANGGDLERALAAYNYGPTRMRNESTLPAGARRYVATVTDNLRKVNATTLPQQVNGPSLGATMRFDSSARARRYARSLGRRVANAEFSSRRLDDGSWGVSMTVGDAGLSYGDRLALAAAGWPGAGRD